MVTLYTTRFNIKKFYILAIKCISMLYVDVRKQKSRRMRWAGHVSRMGEER